MHYITLDTNTWIYLANGTEPVKLLHYLNSEVEKGNIKILLPLQVVTEWENNKEKNVKQGSLKHFGEIKEALDRLLKLLGEKGEKDILKFLLDEKDDNDYFEDFVDKFNLKKKEIEDAVTENIKLIDKLFSQQAIIINADESIYKKCGEYALQKKAPFKLKNSFADALIIFSLLEYLKKEKIENAIFVTYNTDDFCEKRDGKKTLHPDLKKEFNDVKCLFYKIVGEALKTIKEDIISKEELEYIEEMQNEENWSYSPEFCEVCRENNDRFNEISFGRNVELIDERLKYIENHDQLTFDFSQNFAIPDTKETPNLIEVGYCDWCSTEHFKCINCGTINTIFLEEHNEKKECEGCGLNYISKVTYDRKGFEEEIIYIIPKNTETCQKCGEEFDNEDMIENLCQDCEEEYSYGEK